VDTPGSRSAPPVVMVWRFVRAGGGTKTRKSRRTLELRQRCTDALRLHRDRQDQLRKRAGDRWHDNGFVFASRVGTALWARNVRRSFRAVLAAAGLDPAEWTPPELRHSFVSLMSGRDVPIEKIARRVGYAETTTTETVYRKQIRPLVVGGAEVMDTLFPMRDTDAYLLTRKYDLSWAGGSGPRRINEIVHGQRRVTAGTALRLSRYFGTSERFWLNLQGRYDLGTEKDRLGAALDDIRPLGAAS